MNVAHLDRMAALGDPRSLPAYNPNTPLDTVSEGVAEAPRMRALKKANGLRMARAEVKRNLMRATTKGESLALAASLIEDPDGRLLGMPVAELIGACRRVGGPTARRLLIRAKVSESRRIGDLTDREREALVAVLRGEG